MLNHVGHCIEVINQDSPGQRLCMVALVLTIYGYSSFYIWAFLSEYVAFSCLMACPAHSSS